MIKDSGTRRDFPTGAKRDMAEGKGDMVSMPNAAILRLSKHYEAGAKKYGRWNYTKGIPCSSFLDSALRHIFKYLDGWDDEDHLSAAAFNILGAMEMEAHHKELIDIPSREGKNCFDYDGTDVPAPAEKHIKSLELCATCAYNSTHCSAYNENHTCTGCPCHRGYDCYCNKIIDGDECKHYTLYKEADRGSSEPLH